MKTLRAHLVAHLTEQLDNPKVAAYYAGTLLEIALDWKERSPAPSKIDLIVGLAFGQRRDRNGNAFPDDVVNPELKRLIRRYATKWKCRRGFVQWEIKEAKGPRLPREMHIVRPVLDSQTATPRYLSTRDIYSHIRDHVENPKKVTLLIVAHRHHAWRCVKLARSFGFDAFAPYDELPAAYDKRSSQPWVRGPEYLIHDLISRLLEYQRQHLKTASPSNR